MNVINTNLFLQIKENDTEKHLKEKCYELMKIYSKQELLHIASNPSLYPYLFISLYLERDEIDFALLKKYYLGHMFKHDQHFKDLISQNRFATIDKMLNTDHSKRILLLEYFIDTIDDDNMSIFHLHINENDYKKVSKTLDNLTNYYIEKNKEPKCLQFKKLYR